MRKIVFFILFLITSFVHAKTILIGLPAENPPFESVTGQNGGYYGLEVDIIGEICRRAALTCKFVSVPIGDVLQQLTYGKIDLCIASVAITKEREKTLLFSRPYLKSSVQFITDTDSPIKTVEDIRGKTVGTRYGKLLPEIVINLFQGDIKITELPNISSLFESLNNKNVDVVILDSLIVRYWAANNNDTYKIIGPEIAEGQGYAVVANKDEPALITQINSALENMEQDGTTMKTYNRYIF